MKHTRKGDKLETMPRKKKTPNMEECRAIEYPTNIEDKPKKKKSKWVNPHKREYGIEIVKSRQQNDTRPLLHKVSVDIGFTTAGLTHWNINEKTVKCLYYKKQEECHVKGAGIVYLTKLCKETLGRYMELIYKEIPEDEIQNTQFILEEPLVIAGQKSFSISLYVLLHYMIIRLLSYHRAHSIILVRPGSAKKLLNWGRSKMPDGEKTKWVKNNLPEWGAQNNHMSDSCFSMILTNYDELKQLYPTIELLTKVDYKIYESWI